jgi:hypothetical protein
MVLFFFIPLTVVFVPHNLNQLQVIDIPLVLFFLFLILFFTFLGGFIIKTIFKFSNFFDTCLISSLIISFFFSFARLDFLLVKYLKFQSSYYALLIIMSISLILILLSKLEKFKFFIFVFFTFFSIFKVIGFTASHVLNYFNFGNENNITFFSKLNFENKYNAKTKFNTYFIILDGMISLENAELLNIAKKDETLKKFKEIDYVNSLTYNEKSLSNYTTTHLSVSSMFYLDYFVHLNKYYDSYEKFYPKIFDREDLIEKMPFFKFLKKNDQKFIWVYNRTVGCSKNKYIECRIENKPLQYIFRFIEIFFVSTPLHKFLNSTYLPVYDRALNYFIKYPIHENKNNFIFIHHYSPHGPHVSSDCKKGTNTYESLAGYKESYNCTISEMLNFVKSIKHNDNGANIFFLADHGWSFTENEIYKKNKKEFQKSIINLYFINDSCKNTYPKSPINIMRLALSCINNTKIEPINDIYFEAIEENIFGKRKVVQEKKRF